METIRQKLRAARQRYPWLDHLARAYAQYKANQGDHQAAAITFFSFLSLFPILILAVSVLGFVMAGNDQVRDNIVTSITENLPGGFVSASDLNSLVDARGSVGLVGLVTLLLTGTSWVDNIRSAMESVWGRRPSSRNFFVNKGGDVTVLALLGVTLGVSFAFTAAGTTLTGVLLRPLGLDDAFWASALTLVVGLVFAIAWDTAAFTVVLLRLPRVEVTRASAWRGSLLAAVGFEILKTGGSYYVASLQTNAAVAGFGAVVGLLIWLMLVSRFLLFAAAWTATFPREQALPPVHAVAEAAQEAGEVPSSSARPAPEVSPAALGAGLVGAGAALGAASVGAGRFYRRRRRRARLRAAIATTTSRPARPR